MLSPDSHAWTPPETAGSGSPGADSGAYDVGRHFRGFCGAPLAIAINLAQAPLGQVPGRPISREFTAHLGAHAILALLLCLPQNILDLCGPFRH